MSKTASSQVGPKNEKNRPPGKRVKRGRLHFTEEEVTRQAGEQASGQVGPKSQSTGKFRQDGEREKPSSRLRQEGEAREDTVCEEQAARKDQKDKREKKKERAEAKAEHSAVRLEMAKEKLSRQEPPNPPSLPKQAVMVTGAGVWAYGHRKIHEVEHENVGVEGAHKTELLAEAGAHKVSRYAKRRIREHPARQVRKWERRTIKANADLHYQKMVQENPELNSTFLSRMAQKWKIKREYAKQAREAASQTAKAAGAATTTEKAAAYAAQFVRRHKGGAVIVLLLFCLFLIRVPTAPLVILLPKRWACICPVRTTCRISMSTLIPFIQTIRSAVPTAASASCRRRSYMNRKWISLRKKSVFRRWRSACATA